MKIKLAKYIAEFLVQHGIKDCFMVTGGGAMHLDDAIGHQEGITCTFNHHEQACSIAAEGYTRMTGNLAAVCVTSGPGGTNAITGVMGGWLDSIPMFVLSGQVKRETTIWSCPDLHLRQLGDQEFDIINSVQNMTKYAVMVTNPQEIAYHLEKALFLATDGRGGPVWLDIPLDVQGAMIETDELIHFNAAQEKPWHLPDLSDEKVVDIINKIKNAKAPLILAGTGIRLGKAEKEFLAVLEKLQIPVVTAWNANDTLAYDSLYFAGMPGTVGTRAGNFAVQNCDLLISLGCRLNIRMIGYNHFDFAKNAYKIIVDIDKRELCKPTIKVDMPVHGDVKDVLQKLLASDYAADGRHKEWLAWCRGLVQKYNPVEESYHNAEKLINPYVFIEKLFDQLDEYDRIICGNGSACVITFQAAKIKQGQRMFTNSGCAAMGYGFPAALGVAVADNARRTICIDGDGSLMMNVQELATVVQNKLNVKLFIINNNGYHSIRQTQRNLFKPPFIGIDRHSGVGFPDFAKLADAFGMKYFSFSNENDCDDIIKQVLQFEGACICEAVVDYEQNFAPKSSSKVLPDGKIVSPSMDDMFPFLPREEFESIRFCK
ncbi:thiamine pyrophosphate-binding protein [Veillonellaceae bacterium WCA-693-APC-5D-A]|uniref:Thiamine pyrophosphate-binding protein n=1 Tax=Anaerovibrio slackiae TaxID=2652309 RepID=A0A6I2UCY7_9FIRM|nr:thiamine pyrophosphate-binding protein [Anaerovibrio slackiae]MSU08587.1 thiamine pyrophosphate-binding protein [Anaerovibrio slackiae]